MNPSNRSGQLRVLMLGYNGANNTGAEALLQSDIEDVRAVLGPRTSITVPTLNEVNLRRYLSECDDLRIVRIPTLYFGAIRRLVRESDVVMLVEGSTYMDSWGSPLLWAFLWATHCAARQGKRSLAYAVDAGKLSGANERRVRRVASLTDLIVVRNRTAADRLRRMGVSAPVEWTADNAFTYVPAHEDRGWVERRWPVSTEGVIGIALVDFSLWPVVPRPWGGKDTCYKWPYYFSQSAERRRAREELAAGYAGLADRIASHTGCAVALICMEQVDEQLANAVKVRMNLRNRARVFSAREHDASRMTMLLRSLRLLVTSRFHAAVLSLAASIPQIAVGHDSRLRTLYEDLGLAEEWFLDACSAEGNRVTLDPDLFRNLTALVERLLADPEQQEAALTRGHAEHVLRAQRNRRLLANFLRRHFGTADVSDVERDSLLPGAAIGGVR